MSARRTDHRPRQKIVRPPPDHPHQGHLAVSAVKGLLRSALPIAHWLSGGYGFTECLPDEHGFRWMIRVRMVDRPGPGSVRHQTRCNLSSGRGCANANLLVEFGRAVGTAPRRGVGACRVSRAGTNWHSTMPRPSAAAASPAKRCWRLACTLCASARKTQNLLASIRRYFDGAQYASVPDG